MAIQDGADWILWWQELAHRNSHTATGPCVPTVPWMLLSSRLGCARADADWAASALLDRLGLDPSQGRFEPALGGEASVGCEC